MSNRGSKNAQIDINSIMARHADWLVADQPKNDPRRADLQYADLQYADLRSANLRSANLRDVDLRGANLRRADLRDVNLQYADLRGADLLDADLRGADLLDADLHGANLQGADLRGANIDFSSGIPLWCGGVEISFDERQQQQIVYHALANAPLARAAAGADLIAWVNKSHVVCEHGLTSLVAEERK